MSLDRFRGKTVLVTGASSGIGEAVARRFSDEGANVTIIARSQPDIDKVGASLPGERTLALAADVSDWDAIQSVVADTVARFGGLDVVVANAGIAPEGTVETTSPDTFREVIDINLTGIFQTVKAAYAELKKTKGCVIATSSVSGIRGDWNQMAYNASKGGVSNLVRALALDAGKDGIRVNAVNPTFTRSGLTEEMADDPKIVAGFDARVPLGSPAEPDWIAGPVAFLASDDARYITGVNLPVDGGVTASNGQPA